jgi:hypothetical protein
MSTSKAWVAVAEVPSLYKIRGQSCVFTCTVYQADLSDSDTTKVRFMNMYRFPDKILPSEIFNSTVLELVKYLQSGLSIFGLFEQAEERNGLLCEVTTGGLQRWIIDFGNPFLSVEVSPLLSRCSGTQCCSTQKEEEIRKLWLLYSAWLWPLGTSYKPSATIMHVPLLLCSANLR